MNIEPDAYFDTEKSYEKLFPGRSPDVVRKEREDAEDGRVKKEEDRDKEEEKEEMKWEDRETKEMGVKSMSWEERERRMDHHLDQICNIR